MDETHTRNIDYGWTSRMNSFMASPVLVCGYVLWFSFASTVIACNQPAVHIEPEGIDLYEITPNIVLPGTSIVFRGSGFLPEEVYLAVFEGDHSGEKATSKHYLTYRSSSELVLRLRTTLFPDFDEIEGIFTGIATVKVRRGEEWVEASLSTRIFLVESLRPMIAEVQPEVVSFMEPLMIHGANFLLGAEGVSHIVLEGRLEQLNGAGSRDVKVEIVGTPQSRTTMELTWTPSILGLVTGFFQGTLSVRNDHSGAGASLESTPVPVGFDVLAPAVSSFGQPGVRRGQEIDFIGRGFLPEDPQDAAGTLFLWEGFFEPRAGNTQDWTGKNAPILDGTFKEAGRIRYIVRPGVTGAGTLEGFGSKPGTFTGQVTPLLTYQGETLKGLPWKGDFKILPTVQVVYLKYLPTFSEGLRRFGLRNVEYMVRERIIEVCRRDYDGYNVDFREERPTDYVDYSVIEIAGRDPNQSGLFGLDNTVGLDVGNIRLDDVIGGYNAETEEQGYFSYGGVFLESFLAFSPSLGWQSVPEEHRSSRFDDIFGLFIPELNGNHVQIDEIVGGAREDAINKAIRALGSILGNTVVHEIGHALGMVTTPGRYHHSGREPGLIMNPGHARSFEERAEIDGHGPSVWHQIDKQYLHQILPQE